MTDAADPAPTTRPTGEAAARTARGLRAMGEVYQADFADQAQAAPTPYMDATVGHLFADVWSRTDLSIRDRRLITIGVIAALGHRELLEIQFRAALAKSELSPAQIDEIVLHLAYYVGWPNGTEAMFAARAAIEGAEQAAAAGTTSPSASGDQ